MSPEGGGGEGRGGGHKGGQWLSVCSLSYSPAARTPAGVLQDKTGHFSEHTKACHWSAINNCQTCFPGLRSLMGECYVCKALVMHLNWGFK